ncbi:hypothetical protein [Streptomyces filamentosus]|uniref:hypothetical protein n=1 Tax=Streptomyces filamentosus TaxID=67294 RepID=UPI00123B378B|nr:hypothetical protein [Streptomyces filamentosus]KAA6216402.1 hypothetical protein CP979_05180 [Streptomyces filamentosus]
MASFTDDFNRPDSSSLGAGWVEVSGDWSIVSGQLSPGNDGGTIILRAAAAMDGNENYAQATIAATAAASQGVWCRGNAGISTGYLWRNDGTTWDLFRVAASTFTSIGSYEAAAAPGDVMRVQAVGSTIKGYVNGVERVSVTDTGVTTGTGVGIRCISTSALRFDSFAAGDIVAGTALTLAAETDSVQALTATKAFTAGLATAVETAQSTASSKTADTGTAGETAAAQPLAGAKALLTPAAAETDTARPLAGAKTAVLGPAVETSTARPLAAADATGALGVTVGTPRGLWAAGQGRPTTWSAGCPRT